MIRVCTIILVRDGVMFRRRDTVRDDMAMVKRRPAHMTRVLDRTFVTARVEQAYPHSLIAGPV